MYMYCIHTYVQTKSDTHTHIRNNYTHTRVHTPRIYIYIIIYIFHLFKHACKHAYIELCRQSNDFGEASALSTPCAVDSVVIPPSGRRPRIAAETAPAHDSFSHVRR